MHDSENPQQRRAIYRIAIASDLHAHTNSMDYTSGKNIPSWITPKATAATKQNPLADLQVFIKDTQLTADVLLCPGDIADKADDVAMNYAWQELQSIGKMLGVSAIVGSVGNHDLHSRAAAGTPDGSGITENPLPQAHIRTLFPTFPIASDEENRRFWADHVAISEDDICRIVTLNSCSSHGYIFEGSDEYKRGRFTPEAENQLISLIKATETKPINILLTHHHPQKVSELTFTDESTMIRGDRLIKVLGTGEYGSWMIVHGHRHVASFQLGHGDNDRPYIFSAGSLGVILQTFYYPDRPPNQFYMIEFDLLKIEEQGGLYGTIKAWDWHFGKGWKRAEENASVPGKSGFGSRTKPLVLAKQVAEYIKGKASESGTSTIYGISEDDVAKSLPDISYLMPTERLRFKQALEGLNISTGRHPASVDKFIFAYICDEKETEAAK